MARLGKKEISRTDSRFVLNKLTSFSVIEAYNSARTNLMFSLSTKKKKAVLVTSNAPGEGKSSTSINLAMTFAKTGAKILLIDADLRKPSVQAILGIKNSRGLSSLIGKFCSFEEAVNRDVTPNLDVICSGPIPPNPAELLTSAYVAELLAFFNRKYDYIFIDTPPIGVVSDALLLNYLVAGIVFVVKENSTTHNDIKNSLRSIDLAKGNLLGFIKVGCKTSGGVLGRKYSYRNKKYNYEYRQSTKDTKPVKEKETKKKVNEEIALDDFGADLDGFDLNEIDNSLDDQLKKYNGGKDFDVL
jgi:capsular exopolysaccharide synthesis family protein